MKRICAVWAALLSLVSSTALAQDYRIKLQRPHKAGHVRLLRASTHIQRNTSLFRRGKPDQKIEKNWLVELDVQQKILEVDKRGQYSASCFIVAGYVKNPPEEKWTHLPAGSVIFAYAEDLKDVFFVDGYLATPEEKESIRGLLYQSKGGASYDEVFGTGERKKVGDKWDLNVSIIASEIEKSKGHVSKDDISGHVKLEEVFKVDSVECLQVYAKIEMKNMSALAPPDYSKCWANTWDQVSWIVPTDPNLELLEVGRKKSTEWYCESKAESGNVDMYLEMSDTHQDVWQPDKFTGDRKAIDSKCSIPALNKAKREYLARKEKLDKEEKEKGAKQLLRDRTSEFYRQIGVIRTGYLEQIYDLVGKHAAGDAADCDGGVKAVQGFLEKKRAGIVRTGRSMTRKYLEQYYALGAKMSKEDFKAYREFLATTTKREHEETMKKVSESLMRALQYGEKCPEEYAYIHNELIVPLSQEVVPLKTTGTPVFLQPKPEVLKKAKQKSGEK